MMVALVLAAALAAAAPTATPEQQILAVLADAEAGWNAGDLERYMQSYWHSDRLRFAGGDRVTTGWQATLDRYRAHYADQAAMGHLAFTDLDVTMLADDAALVFGRWRLTGLEGEPHGLFTLVFRRFPEGWRAVHDHTSSAD
ncbi:MAG TPA: nuclear transport factor 2 family protein [Candidatus Krumholzibacteria bacterium]|nr:nuclear transport factor 2 family protein [Candidatus Krumholzibacteria bacterium]